MMRGELTHGGDPRHDLILETTEEQYRDTGDLR